MQLELRRVRFATGGRRENFGLFSQSNTLLSAPGFAPCASIPHGLRGGVAMAMARSDGGMVAYLSGAGQIDMAALSAAGNITATITAGGAVSFANLAGGINISAALAGIGSISPPTPYGKGSITCSISIGAAPSAFDIAQAVITSTLTGVTAPNNVAEALKKTLKRDEYLGLS
jgi:hypothetical protein